MRQATNQGPATVREIYETLTQGGYQFDAKDETNAMRGLRISLGKNTQKFHKLPNGVFGLVAWYPNLKVPQRGNATADEEDNGKSANEDTEEKEGDE